MSKGDRESARSAVEAFMSDIIDQEDRRIIIDAVDGDAYGFGVCEGGSLTVVVGYIDHGKQIGTESVVILPKTLGVMLDWLRSKGISSGNATKRIDCLERTEMISDQDSKKIISFGAVGEMLERLTALYQPPTYDGAVVPSRHGITFDGENVIVTVALPEGFHRVSVTLDEALHVDATVEAITKFVDSRIGDTPAISKLAEG